MDLNELMGELEALHTAGTKVPGFRGKVMIETDKLIQLSQNLRNSLPENIKEAQEVINQKNSIVNQAYLEAKRMRTEAEQEVLDLQQASQKEHDAKVGESEVLKSAEAKGDQLKGTAATEAQDIIQDAQRRAYSIISEAENAGETRREGADRYAWEILSSLEEQLATALGQVRRGLDSLRSESEVVAR